MHLVDILGSLDDKVENNERIIEKIEQLAQAIFTSWFVNFEPFGGIMPNAWRVGELWEVATLGAGGDKPVVCTPIQTEECAVPIFSNGIDNFGLYGYTNFPKVIEESVTVSARGTIGYVCLRQEPFVPIVRLVTAIPNKKYITAKYLYFYLRNIHIAGVGTTQQQLTVPDFKKYCILIPSIEVVENFSNIADSLFEKANHCRAENNKLIELKQAYLKKFFG